MNIEIINNFELKFKNHPEKYDCMIRYYICRNCHEKVFEMGFCKVQNR